MLYMFINRSPSFVMMHSIQHKLQVYTYSFVQHHKSLPGLTPPRFRSTIPLLFAAIIMLHCFPEHTAFVFVFSTQIVYFSNPFYWLFGSLLFLATFLLSHYLFHAMHGFNLSHCPALIIFAPCPSDPLLLCHGYFRLLPREKT